LLAPVGRRAPQTSDYSWKPKAPHFAFATKDATATRLRTRLGEISFFMRFTSLEANVLQGFRRAPINSCGVA
jgi:hypothetical protein